MTRDYRNPGKVFFIINEWEQSGITKADFCRSRKIPKSTFYYWHKKYKEQKEDTPNPFIRVKIKEDTKPSPQACGMTISYPNGVRVTLDGQANIQYVRELINIFQ
jgi:hypothetical protein